MASPAVPRQPGPGLTRLALEEAARSVWKCRIGSSLRPAKKPVGRDVAVSASVPVSGAQPHVVLLCASAAAAIHAAVELLGLQEDEIAPVDIDDAFAELVIDLASTLGTQLPDGAAVGTPLVVHGSGLTSVVAGAGLVCDVQLVSGAGPVQVSLWRPRA